MIGCEDGQFGDPARFVKADIDRELMAGLFAGAQKARMADFGGPVRPEP